MDMKQTYREFESLIRGKAYKISSKYHIPFGECLSEANEIFCQAFLSFDETKAAFSTHLMTQLLRLSRLVNPNVKANHQALLNDSIYEETNVKDGDEKMTLESIIGEDDKQFSLQAFKSDMDSLSQDARILCAEIVFGDLNHDRRNYRIALLRDRKPVSVDTRNGQVKTRKVRAEARIINVDLCCKKWAFAHGWTRERTEAAYREVREYLNTSVKNRA